LSSACLASPGQPGSAHSHMGRQRAAACGPTRNLPGARPAGRARHTARATHTHTEIFSLSPHTHTPHTHTHTAHIAGRREERQTGRCAARHHCREPCRTFYAPPCVWAPPFSKLHTPFETSASQLGTELSSATLGRSNTEQGLQLHVSKKKGDHTTISRKLYHRPWYRWYNFRLY